MRFLRFLLALSVLVGGILTVSYMQKKFDEGDLRRAVGAVQAKFPVRDCRAEVISRFRGTVRVACGERRFFVDVVKGIIESAP